MTRADERGEVRARLEALRSNPPREWDEVAVSDFHDIVGDAEEAYDRDFSWSRIPRERMRQFVIGTGRSSRTGRPSLSRRKYTDTFYCDDDLFANRQVDALCLCIEKLDSEVAAESAARPLATTELMELSGGENSVAADPGPIQTGADAVTSGASKCTQIRGPDGMELLLDPYTDGYVWRLRNGSLHSINRLELTIFGARSLDAAKSAFREPSTIGFRRHITSLSAGQATVAAILVRIEGDHLGIGDSNGLHPLSWPSGDQSEVQRWLLEMRITGLSEKWQIGLDLRWIAGTRKLDVSVHAGANTSRHSTLKEEATVRLFSGQEYPKTMHHATKAPVVVNSRREQEALGPEWSETYIHQAYPKCKYGWKGKTIDVKSPEEEQALGIGWADGAGAFEPYVGARPAKSAIQDPTRWVDERAIPGASPRDRDKIKAQLLRADAAFWRSPDTPTAFIDPMRKAFSGIADVYWKAGILNEGVLREQIPILVWEAAVAGGWYRAASSNQEGIFPEQIGRYWVWRDEDIDWNNLFHSERQEGMAHLLENPAGLPEMAPEKSGPPPSKGNRKDLASQQSERAARRQAVVNPILKEKGWKRNRLGTEAGVGKGPVYEYLDGSRAWISEANGQAIADALGLDVSKLPDVGPQT